MIIDEPGAERGIGWIGRRPHLPIGAEENSALVGETGVAAGAAVGVLDVVEVAVVVEVGGGVESRYDASFAATRADVIASQDSASHGRLTRRRGAQPKVKQPANAVYHARLPIGGWVEGDPPGVLEAIGAVADCA